MVPEGINGVLSLSGSNLKVPMLNYNNQGEAEVAHQIQGGLSVIPSYGLGNLGAGIKSFIFKKPKKLSGNNGSSIAEGDFGYLNQTPKPPKNLAEVKAQNTTTQAKGDVATETPTLFGNKFPGHEIDTPKIVPNERLQNVSGKFNYVVKEDGSLVVGKTGHTSLTGGAPAQAAGEIKIVNGSVKSVDNASGHFQPVGVTIESITENAFKNIGIDTSGKYIFKEWVTDPSLPRGGRWAPAKK